MDSLFDQTKPHESRDRVKISLSSLYDVFMASNPEMVDVACPFCNDDKKVEAFLLKDCHYHHCLNCDSLYNTPRLSRKSLADYYAIQPTEEFDHEILPALRERRINLIMRPRWKKLRMELDRIGINFPVEKAMEVGAGIGHFIEVLQEDNVAKHYLAVEPATACNPMLERLPGTEIVNTFLEDAPIDTCGNCDMIFLNSVIEHPFSLTVFFEKIHQFLRPGGIVLLVDMHSGGLDIEVLRQDTQNINPHLILQVGSIEGVRQLGDQLQLELIKSFSVGQMDVDILYDYAKTVSHNHPLKGFARLLRSDDLRQSLQTVLSNYLATGYNGYILKKRN